MPDGNNHGLVHISSPRSVAETLQRLETILQSKGMMIFARIDHSGEAAKVGLEMHDSKLLIFGSPRAGTPLMVAAPTLAIDLPLKALVWEDDKGKVWITHNSPQYLRERHAIPEDLVNNIAGAGALIRRAVE